MTSVAESTGSSLPKGPESPRVPPDAPDTGSDPCMRFDLKALLRRAHQIIRYPRETWRLIAQEQTSPGNFVKFYLAPLAAIPPLSGFISAAIVGFSVPFLGRIRSGFFSTFYHFFMQYLGQLATVLIVAAFLAWLAPKFQGKTDQGRTAKLISYSMTPACLLGGVVLIGSPGLMLLALILSLYGFYLFYRGMPVMTAVPKEQEIPFLVVSAVGAFVIGAAMHGLVWLVTPSILPEGFNSMPSQGEQPDLQKLEEQLNRIQRQLSGQ